MLPAPYTLDKRQSSLAFMNQYTSLSRSTVSPEMSSLIISPLTKHPSRPTISMMLAATATRLPSCFERCWYTGITRRTPSRKRTGRNHEYVCDAVVK